MNNTLFLPIGTFFILLIFLFHLSSKEKYTILFLFAAAFFLFSFSAMYYPFLNVWDERFHALVAKNLMNHPLLPTLYDDPVVNMVYNDNWARFHIWVHKQPLFMWQMALSYKIFGVNEFAMRLPNVVLGCLMVYGGYRSGKILGNKNTGFITAVLLITSSHLMQILSGKLELDQNDFSFIAYISLSLWAWLEYVETKRKYWIILIGLFSGCALLCKWLVGLFVYLCWGLVSIVENKFQPKKYWDIALALLVTAAVFLPWQILILNWYPAEARASFQFNIDHFTEASDGHVGPFSYHFDLINKHFGSLVLYLILPSFVVFYFKTSYKKVCLALIVGIVFVYLFFSAAVTKMPCFTSVVILPMYISIAFLVEFLFSYFEKLDIPKFVKHAVIIIGFIVFSFVRLDVAPFFKNGSFPGLKPDEYYMSALSHNKNVFQRLHLPENTVLFNVTGKHYIEAMFYTGLPAYNFIPSEDQYLDTKHKNRRIAVFKPLEGEIPQYLSNDKEVILLRDTIRPCE